MNQQGSRLSVVEREKKDQAFLEMMNRPIQYLLKGWMRKGGFLMAPHSRKKGSGSSRFEGSGAQQGRSVVECLPRKVKPCSCRNCKNGGPKYDCQQLSASYRRILKAQAA